jgi:hypothetical protein
VKKGFEIPNVAIRVQEPAPEDRKSNRIKARRFALARVFRTMMDNPGRFGGSTWDEIKIDKLCSQRHLARFALSETKPRRQ